jgi:SAM-dependent methyltransferase
VRLRAGNPCLIRIASNPLSKRMTSPKADLFAAEEHHKMAAVEDTMFYYIGLHALLEGLLLKRFKSKSLAVLDAGCGTGGFIKRLKGRYSRWTFTGIDFSPVACSLARQRTEATILQGSILDLPFEDHTFDCVVTADVLYHLQEDTLALKEIARVLKPEGILLINLPAHAWLWSYHDDAVAGLRRYNRKGLSLKLRDAGFEIQFCSHWNTLLLPLIYIRRKLLPAPESGSDVKAYSPLVEWLGRKALASEQFVLSLGIALPLGSSVIAVARKRASS